MMVEYQLFFHCYKDPFAPIDTGDVVNPATGDFVVELMGSELYNIILIYMEIMMFLLMQVYQMHLQMQLI